MRESKGENPNSSKDKEVVEADNGKDTKDKTITDMDKEVKNI